MVDRQDIDALLVGALYGELTPADEARLTTHLESHPSDRAALDDLKTARAAVKQSRIFDTQDEPPQAISAMLLQEAHRRAPKPARFRQVGDDGERESWFARLARSFFAHPAMAAAAMLVLVVGVAAVVHNRKGGAEYAGQSAPASETDQLDLDRPGQGGVPPAAAAPAPTRQEQAATGAAAGSASFGVGLAEGKTGKVDDLQKQAERARDQGADKAAVANKLEVTKPSAHMPKSPPSVTAVDPDLQPKDLAPAKTPERAKSMKKGSFESDDTTLGRMDNAEAASSRGANAGMVAPTPSPSPAPAQAAPPPPPKATAAPQKVQIASSAPGGGGGSAPAAGPTTATDARARQLLQQALQYAKQDNCAEAAKFIIQIHDTAPAFYAQNVADNRDLSHCAVYAKKNLEQSEERTQKKAASKAATDSVK